MEALPWGVVKSRVLGNLRDWFAQPIFSSDCLVLPRLADGQTAVEGPLLQAVPPGDGEAEPVPQSVRGRELQRPRLPLLGSEGLPVPGPAGGTPLLAGG